MDTNTTASFRECIEKENIESFLGCLNGWADFYRDSFGALLGLLKSTWSLPAFLLGVAFLLACFAIFRSAPRLLARINMETLNRLWGQLDDLKAWEVITTVASGLLAGLATFVFGGKFDVSILVALIFSLFTMILYMSYFTIPSLETGSRSVQLALEARETWQTLPRRFWNAHKDMWNNFGTAGHCLGVSKSSQMYLTKVLPEHLSLSRQSFLALHDLEKFPPAWFFVRNDDKGDPFTPDEKLAWLKEVKNKDGPTGYKKIRIMMGPRAEFTNFIKAGLDAGGGLRMGSHPQIFLDAMLGPGNGIEIFHFEKDHLEDFLMLRASLDFFEAKSVVAADFALFDQKILIEHDGGHILSIAIGQQAAWYVEFLRALVDLGKSGNLARGLSDFHGTKVTLASFGDTAWKDLA